jgi:hypothetical protein
MNKVLELIRLEDSSAGTFGVLKINKEPFCVTLEPWDWENMKSKSSIPAQQYTMRRYDSPSFGLTFLVENVPGRTAILFHAGNTADDTAGCILLASSFGKLRGERAILNSGKTFDIFMRRMDDVDFAHLTIKEVY